MAVKASDAARRELQKAEREEGEQHQKGSTETVRAQRCTETRALQLDKECRDSTQPASLILLLEELPTQAHGTIPQAKSSFLDTLGNMGGRESAHKRLNPIH